MGSLTDAGVELVHHYTPLHYLPFIARSRALLGKPSLAAAGFSKEHLRSMSSSHDVERGFGEFGFLTLDRHPRILAAKLKAGFPHIGILVPAQAVEAVVYALCRYNVAMTRCLRRGDKTGFPEGPTRGRYYGSKQIPIAVNDIDKASMLEAFVGSSTMVEILTIGDLVLPRETKVICYSDADADLAEDVLSKTDTPWKVIRSEPPGPYSRRNDYAEMVEDYVRTALVNPDWRGDGLEFDRV